MLTDALGRRTFRPALILKPQRHSDTEYLHVTLNLGGVRKTALVHQLVLAAFVGPCPDGQEVLHSDDCGENNKLTNLRYGTRSENNLDKVRNGNDHNATKTHCPQRHRYTPENTYHYGNRRQCKACTMARAAARRQARKECAA